MWLHWDSRIPLGTDSVKHLIINFHYFDYLAAGKGLLYLLQHLNPTYPPLYHLMVQGIFQFSGKSADAATLVNLPFMAILLFSIHGIGKDRYGHEVGLLAAFFTCSLPPVLTAALFANLSLPLTAMTSMSLYLFLRAEDFSSRRYSLLFGGVLGIGLLVKWSILFFSTPVLVASLCKILFHNQKSTHLKNLSLAAILSAGIAATWYIPHFMPVLQHAAYSETGYANDGAPGFSLQSLIFYIPQLWDNVSILQILFFTIGIIWIFLDKNEWHNSFYIILFLAVPFILLSVLHTKDLRHLLPLLPVSSLVACFWIPRWIARLQRFLPLPPKHTKHLSFAILLVCGTLIFTKISFGVNIWPEKFLVYGFSYLNVPSAPQQNNFKIAEVCHFIMERRNPLEKSTKVAVIPTIPRCVDVFYNYYADLNSLPLRFLSVSKNNYRDLLLHSDFIILNTGKAPPHLFQYYSPYDPWVLGRCGANSTLPRSYIFSHEKHGFTRVFTIKLDNNTETIVLTPRQGEAKKKVL